MVETHTLASPSTRADKRVQWQHCFSPRLGSKVQLLHNAELYANTEFGIITRKFHFRCNFPLRKELRVCTYNLATEGATLLKVQTVVHTSSFGSMSKCAIRVVSSEPVTYVEQFLLEKYEVKECSSDLALNVHTSTARF